jgi:hypothetical protein
MKNQNGDWSQCCYCCEKLSWNYAEIHGLPSPGRSVNRITQSVIFLPAETTYKSVLFIRFGRG